MAHSYEHGNLIFICNGDPEPDEIIEIFVKGSKLSTCLRYKDIEAFILGVLMRKRISKMESLTPEQLKDRLGL